jgi:hypothetical protein
MAVNLSDDLRQALKDEGTPLRLIDPATGESYVLYRESDRELIRNQIPNSRLLEMAKLHKPPVEWLDGDEEELF